MCVSKQLWFEKIRGPAEWKQNLMRQQSPARSTTLPSSGRQGEGSSAGPSHANTHRSGWWDPFPACTQCKPSLRKLRWGLSQHSVLPSPNLPPVLMLPILQPALCLQAALAFLSRKSGFIWFRETEQQPQQLPCSLYPLCPRTRWLLHTLDIFQSLGKTPLSGGNHDLPK